jgi:hypothetical protein
MLMTMRRWMLVVLGIAVAALAVVLIVGVGGSGAGAKPDAEPAVKAPPVTPPAPAPAPAPAPRVQIDTPAPAVVDTDEDQSLAMEAAVEVHSMEVLLAGDVPQEVMRVAAKCYQGEAGDRERMEIDYKLRIRNGVATMSRVVLRGSQIRSTRLEQCAVEALKTHTWKLDGAPDLDKDMTASISVLDLKKRNRRFGE